MSTEMTYDYTIIRVVPRVERGERINVGVILSCVDAEFLEARIAVDAARLTALDPDIDLDAVHAALDSILRVCAGGSDAGAIGELPPRNRFRWLASPRSTIVQPSRVHTGRTCDPRKTLDHLLSTMVLAPTRRTDATA